MDDAKPKRRPGDLILDRYMPNATEAEREKARQNLYAFAAVILRVCTRIAEERQDAIRASKPHEIE